MESLCRVTMLAGFRWVNLCENLQGALEPPTFPWEPPFWNTTTTNNLYGFQIGAEERFSSVVAFRLTGWSRPGFSTTTRKSQPESAPSKYRDYRPPRPTTPPSLAKPACSASIKSPNGLCSRPVTKRSGCKALLWHLDKSRKRICPPTTVAQALGVNCNSGVFYHGATAGLEYSF